MKFFVALSALALAISISTMASADAVEASAAGGASYRSFFGIPTTMGSLNLGLGARLSENLAAHGGLDFDLGQTDHGLTTRRFDFSPTLERIAGRARFGAGFDLLWFDVQRVSTGERIGQAGAGAHVQASFDPFQSRGASLFIGARLGADLMIGPPTIVSGSMLGASAMGGLRF